MRQLHYLGRAAYQDGDVLDILVQTWREALPTKVGNQSAESAKGAEYDTQGQAPGRSEARRPSVDA